MRKLVALVAVAVMALTACGGDDDDSDSAETSDPATTLPEGVDADEDQAAVDDAVLQLSDLPSGWREETSEDDDEDGSLDDFEPDECADIKAAADAVDDTETANTDSSTFVLDDGEIENSVGASSSEESVVDFFAALDDTSSANECFEVLIQEGIESQPDSGDVEITDVSVGRTSPGDFGDETAAYQIQVDLEAEGQSASAYVDFVFVRIGRFAAAFNFTDVFSPTDPELVSDTIDAVVGRLEDSSSAA